MAYIQITTRCNMTCPHCSVSCNVTDGEHMSMDIFKKAVELSESGNYDTITLGGGEPTLHPQFWEFLGHAMGSDRSPVWMATNGKRKRISLALADLSRNNIKFRVALSQDDFHDPIHPDVIKKFKANDLEIRHTPPELVINKGAAKDNGIGVTDRCACAETLVEPDGRVSVCGCPGSLVLGDIHTIDTDVVARSRRLENERGRACGLDLTQAQINYILHNEGDEAILKISHG